MTESDDKFLTKEKYLGVLDLSNSFNVHKNVCTIIITVQLGNISMLLISVTKMYVIDHKNGYSVNKT